MRSGTPDSWFAMQRAFSRHRLIARRAATARHAWLLAGFTTMQLSFDVIEVRHVVSRYPPASHAP